MDLIKKSIGVIKSLQLKNGGITATPLNEAYPYVYVRDGVIITKAFNKAGLHKNSEKFYHFINKMGRIDHYGEIFHRYGECGRPCVTRKKENDNSPLVIHGIYDTYLHNKDESFLGDMWHLIEGCVKFIFSISRKGLAYTERSVQEFYRLERGYEIWVNSICCRALFDAAEIAKVLGREKEMKKWKSKAESLLENIKKKMFNKKLGVFVKNLRFPNSPDMSQLAPFYFNIINSKVLLKKTLNYLKKHLWYKELGGFRRFGKFDICKDWHWYSGGSGAWLFLTLWAARFYKEVGDMKNYQECVSWVEDIARKSGGFLPEHIAIKEEYSLWKEHETEFNKRTIRGMKGAENRNKIFKKKYKKDIIYWALPLGWAHAEYILLKAK